MHTANLSLWCILLFCLPFFGSMRLIFPMLSFRSLTAKLETIDLDERLILHLLGASDVDQILKHVYNLRKPFEKTNTTSDMYTQSWNNVTLKSLHELQTIYKFDFLMFDYPTDPFL